MGGISYRGGSKQTLAEPLEAFQRPFVCCGPMLQNVLVAIVRADPEEGFIWAAPLIENFLDHVFTLPKLKSNWPLIGFPTGIAYDLQGHPTGLLRFLAHWPHPNYYAPSALTKVRKNSVAGGGWATRSATRYCPWPRALSAADRRARRSTRWPRPCNGRWGPASRRRFLRRQLCPFHYTAIPLLAAVRSTWSMATDSAQSDASVQSGARRPVVRRQRADGRRDEPR